MRYVNAPNTAFGEDRRSYKTGTDGVTSSQTVFNVSYDNGRVEAYLNGVRLYPGDDFTKTSSGIGTSITLASAIGASNVLEIVGYQGINSGNALVEDNFVVGTGSTGSGGSYTNSTTVFPVASSVGDTVSVWRNGIKLVPTTDYTVSVSAQTVTLGSAASSADEITVQVVGGVIHNNGLTVNSGSNSFSLPTTRGTDAYVLTRDDSLGTGGTAWKETIQSPTISSITYPTQNGVQATALSATGAQDATAETLLITGSNFTSTVTVNISGNSVSSSAFAGTVSVNGTGTVITCSSVTKRASADNYTLTVTNSTGLNVTTTVNFSADPSFTTGSGSIGTVFTGSAMSTKTITAGSSVSWYEGTPTMPTWMTHFSDADTGTSKDLTGTPTNTGTSEVQNFNIIIRDSENQSHNRDFSLTVVDPPTGGNGNNTYTPTGSSTEYYVVKFTADGTFTLYHDVTVDYLVIGGGGSGGHGSGSGGGGAGGFLTGTSLSMTAGAYAVDVGTGGTISTSSTTQANSGSPSIVTRNSDSTVMLKALGGGYGGNENNTLSSGGHGGSGGGARGHDTTAGRGTAGNASDSGVVVNGVADPSSLHHGNGGATGVVIYYGAGGGGAGQGGYTSGNSGTGGQGGYGRDVIMGLTNTLSAELLSLSNIDAGEADGGTRWLAGGGGGQRQHSTSTSFTGTDRAQGGKGGGGNGGYYNQGGGYGGAEVALANTGSGGGGSHNAYGNPTPGADGIVILRFAI